jgi:hypothetical protein
MMSSSYYTHGAKQALIKLGMSADMFAEFAEQDQTNVDSENPNGPANPPAIAKNVDKTPSWSGQNSLESGDAGTRNYQMGLPRAGGV